MPISRRTVLKATGTLGIASAFPAILRAAPAVELIVVHGSPNKHVISAGGVEPWMARLTEIVGDAVSYKYYPAGQLADLKGLLNAVQSGIADAVPVPVGYASDKMPLNGVSMLPGFGTTAKQNIQTYASVMKKPELMQEFQANKVVPIWNMAYPPYQYFSTQGPTKKASDFQGKVIRSAGGSMNLAIKALGASPAEIPAGDIYVAMERGTVSSTFSAYSSVKGYGVQELCNAASRNGSFGTFTNVFSIREDKWEKIPDDIKQAMMQAGENVQKSIAALMDGETVSLAKEFTQAGLEIYEFPASELDIINGKLQTVHDDWVERLKGRGLPADKVLEYYRAALES